MTTAKTDCFIFLLGWIDFWWKGMKIWWGGGEWANFWFVGGLPHPPSRKNPVSTLSTCFYIQRRSFMHIPYIMCQSGQLTSARFHHFVCHRYIYIYIYIYIYKYGIYFHLSVQCLQYNKFITSWTCLIKPNDERCIFQKSISH